ncbi:hypothetical protein N7532_006033 [Penicillium argentinense]|uniref:LsmAD domain-containing protein n=1 Tax=Penicillium argentinense TaxID=1131581 RepID=A0A9W9KBK0_9EURO|nr:uncharacterized protein N7532_006033 [Penicillium argentinense]KAJ5099032.1 hypothetical protein N7532_006033 [Penicillium argentinense]
MASSLNSAPAASSSGNATNSSQSSGRPSGPSLRPSASIKGDGRRQSNSPGDAGQRYDALPLLFLSPRLVLYFRMQYSLCRDKLELIWVRSVRDILANGASVHVPLDLMMSSVCGLVRSNSHKAWSQGTNPITQRSTNNYSNSNGSNHKQSASPRPGQKESSTADHHAHDRVVFLCASYVGLQTTITTNNGDQYTGIMSSSAIEPNSGSSFLLKMVQRSSQENQPKSNGVSDVTSPYLGATPEHSMSFDFSDIAGITVPKVSPAEVTVKESNGASRFRTDADISGNLAMRERTLQRWEPAEGEVNMSLETSVGDTAGWDQFAANEKLFGAKTDYDESIYTTSLDRNSVTYRQKAAEAAKIAAEIEGTNVDNPHMLEERGLTGPDTGDQDEEDKYSGVRRENKAFPSLVSGQPNKYTPPARRQTGAPSQAAPQQAATTSGATLVSAAPADAEQTPAAVKPQPQQEPNAASNKSSADATAASAKRAATENGTATFESKVRDDFRQFASSEKAHVAKVQERRRNQVAHDRIVKLNELMKFSKNFKLSTPVPKDLVPILAKDRAKQEAIISRVSEEKTSPKTTTPPAEQKPQTGRAVPSGPVPSAAPADRQTYPRRSPQGAPPTGPLAAGLGGRFPQQPMQPGRPGASMLSHRLVDNLQQRKGAGVGPGIPAPLPIQDPRTPPTGPANEQHRITSPVKPQASASTGHSKFNVRAMEFKPNPAANTFTPAGTNSSSSGGGPTPGTTATAASNPRSFSRNRSVSRASSPSAFFGAKKPVPIAERPSIDDQFNAIKRMKKEGAESAEKSYSFNGGIPPPYKTLPTWDHPESNREKTFDQMFKAPGGMPSASPQGRSTSNNPHLPQQHPMSFHPGMPPSSGPPNGPHLHQGPHGPATGHMDDHHRLQMSASSPQVFPSPRLQYGQMGYPSPMVGAPAQAGFGQGMPPQAMPQYYPSGQVRYPPGPQMTPFMNNPGATMGGAPMMQQPSNGPYVGGMSPYNPQMQMYSPSPGHAYPQHAPPQPHSGYPSPSRGAPMMMHQNSQSGQPPQPMMFMSPGQQHGQPGFGPQQPPGELSYRLFWIPVIAHPRLPVAHPGRGNYAQNPHFPSSPHQAHHFPQNQHRAPSTSHNQGHQFSQPPNAPSANTGAATHSAEPTDDNK